MCVYVFVSVCVCVCMCVGSIMCVCVCPETVSAVLVFTFCSYCNHNHFTLMFVCVRVYQRVHLCENIDAVLTRNKNSLYMQSTVITSLK